MDVSIIIVNWNSQEDLKKCLASVITHTHDLTYEIVVIDSGSHDGCEEMLRSEYPVVRFVQSATNLGFARANNRAVEEATGEGLLFLNPDTEITNSAVTALYSYLLSHPGAGIVGCTLLNSNKTIQESCVQAIPTIANQLVNSQFLRRRWPKSFLWGMASLFEEGNEPREVEAISGACLMVRRAIFERVGGFSSDYFMYAEDIDLAYKVRSTGYTNYHVPSVTVTHHGGSSSQRAGNTFATVMMPEAIWRFFRKSRGRAYAFTYRLGMFGSAVVRLLLLGAAWSSGMGSQQCRANRQSSLAKWSAVMRWAMHQDSIVKKYYPLS